MTRHSSDKHPAQQSRTGVRRGRQTHLNIFKKNEEKKIEKAIQALCKSVEPMGPPKIMCKIPLSKIRGQTKIRRRSFCEPLEKPKTVTSSEKIKLATSTKPPLTTSTKPNYRVTKDMHHDYPIVKQQLEKMEWALATVKKLYSHHNGIKSLLTSDEHKKIEETCKKSIERYGAEFKKSFEAVMNHFKNQPNAQIYIFVEVIKLHLQKQDKEVGLVCDLNLVEENRKFIYSMIRRGPHRKSYRLTFCRMEPNRFIRYVKDCYDMSSGTIPSPATSGYSSSFWSPSPGPSSRKHQWGHTPRPLVYVNSPSSPTPECIYISDSDSDAE